MQATGSIKILAGAALFALIPVCVVFAGNLSIPTLMFGRLLVACIALYFMQANKKQLFQLPGKTLFKLGAWSMLMLGAMFSYFAAIRISGMAVSSTLLGTQPLLIVFLATLILKEKITLKSSIAAICTFIGIICITGTSTLLNETKLIGMALAMLSSFLLALNFIVPQKYFPEVGSQQLVFFQSLFQLPLILPFVTITSLTFNSHSITAMIVLGLVCTVFSYTLIYSGSKEVAAQKIGILQSTEYILPVFIGILFYHEQATLSLLLGTSLILGACVVVSTDKR